MRAASYEALFGLLAVTGMRLGEAIALERGRRRSRRRRDHDPRRQGRPRSAGAAAPDRHCGACALRRRRETGCARGRASDDVLPLQRGHAAAHQRRGPRPSRSSPPHSACAPRPAARGSRSPASLRRATLIDWQRRGVDVRRADAVLSTYLGHVSPADTYWYLSAAPELMELAADRLARSSEGQVTALAPAMQAYLHDRLIAQRGASPNTIAALSPDVAAAAAVRDQADRQEPERAGHRRPRRAADRRVPGPPRDSIAATASPTRNNRLGGDPFSVRLPRAAATPSTPASIERVLAIPPKRTERNLVTYLTEPEVDALLAACDRPPGPADATTRCSCSQSRPAADLRAGRPHRRRHHPRQPARTCTRSARDARRGERRWSRHRAVLQSLARRARGAPDRSAVPDHAPASTSAATRSSGASASTSPTPPRAARRCGPSTSRCTRSGTPRDAPAARRQRHHRDRAVARPRADVDHQRLPPRRHEPQEHAIDRTQPLDANPGRYRPPTPSSPSSKPSDYADTFRPFTPGEQALPAGVGIIHRSA